MRCSIYYYYIKQTCVYMYVSEMSYRLAASSSRRVKKDRAKMAAPHVKVTQRLISYVSKNDFAFKLRIKPVAQILLFLEGLTYIYVVWFRIHICLWDSTLMCAVSRNTVESPCSISGVLK